MIDKFIRTGIVFVFAFVLMNCFPGGVLDKGGYVHQLGIYSSGTPVQNSPYFILCTDEAEIKRRKELSPSERLALGPAVKKIKPVDYTGGCERIGETSVFFLFNMWPVTKALDTDYAMGTIAQELEGDTMIHLRTWHETHYYSVLGHVSVLKVKGDVIRYLTVDEIKNNAKNSRRFRKGKRNR